jgi:dCMP deaminase
MIKEKHIQVRIEQCLSLAKLSNCSRRKFGAMLIDPIRNVVLMDGYNGGPRGGGQLCGGSICTRESQNIKSGENIEIGCHHAEMNVICNCAAAGVSTDGAWLIVTGEPCVMCSKLIHHAGISKVIVVGKGYAGANGLDYLTANNVEVQIVDGPADPRLNEIVTKPE